MATLVQAKCREWPCPEGRALRCSLAREREDLSCYNLKTGNDQNRWVSRKFLGQRRTFLDSALEWRRDISGSKLSRLQDETSVITVAEEDKRASFHIGIHRVVDKNSQ